MGENIVTVTAAAEEHIISIMQRYKQPQGMRLAVKRSGCSGFRYDPQIIDGKDNISADDICIKISDKLSLYIMPQDVELLQDTEVDIKLGQLQQKKIIFRNPNAVNECGCGESFAVKPKN